MRKYVGLGLMVLCVLLMLVGCGNGAAEEEVCLVGSWRYVKTTEGDDEQPVIVPEFEQFPPWFAVSEDGETLMELSFEFEEDWIYETAIEGVLVRTGPFHFTIIEQLRVSEWGTEEVPDAYLQYDLENGLLRYTIRAEYGELATYTYFERDLSND